jgi:hypothetical protein
VIGSHPSGFSLSLFLAKSPKQQAATEPWLAYVIPELLSEKRSTSSVKIHKAKPASPERG